MSNASSTVKAGALSGMGMPSLFIVFLKAILSSRVQWHLPAPR